MIRRALTVFLGPAALAGGAALGVWLWRRWGYAVETEDREVPTVPDPPVDAPAEPAGRPDVQDEDEGAGARFHRRYQVDVAESTHAPAELIGRIGADIQRYVPDEIATFEKVVGAPGQLAVGDEYHIAIRSPWDGPVRVVEAEPTRFTLATLEGHLEAGQIRFDARPLPDAPGALRFSIESWARSRDATVDFVYDELGLAKQAQQAMWTFFCERVAEDCGDHKLGEIRVLTERDASDG